MRVEDGSAQQRAQNFRQEQIRDRAQLISGCGMAGHIDAETAQLLDQPPDFGPAGRNFLSDLGAAHDDGCVLHEQADDAAQANVSRLKLVRGGSFRSRGWLANCRCLADAVIMRELGGNDKREPLRLAR